MWNECRMLITTLLKTWHRKRSLLNLESTLSIPVRIWSVSTLRRGRQQEILVQASLCFSSVTFHMIDVDNFGHSCQQLFGSRASCRIVQHLNMIFLFKVTLCYMEPIQTTIKLKKNWAAPSRIKYQLNHPGRMPCGNSHVEHMVSLPIWRDGDHI